jgi:hypothetical protein
MTSDELVSAMRSALAAERDAIRRLDSAAVDEASHLKEKLLEAVLRTGPADRLPLLEGLLLVRDELKRNLVLLAHARDCMRDAHLHAQALGKSRMSIQL